MATRVNIERVNKLIKILKDYDEELRRKMEEAGIKEDF